jgi:transposase
MSDKRITLADRDQLRKGVRDAPRKRRALYRALFTAIVNGRQLLNEGNIPRALKASTEIWRLLGQPCRRNEIHPYLLIQSQRRSSPRQLIQDAFESAGLGLTPGTLDRAQRRRNNDNGSTKNGVARSRPKVSAKNNRRGASIKLTSAEQELLAKIMELRGQGLPFRTIARSLREDYAKILNLVHRAYPGVSFPRFRARQINYQNYPGGPSGKEVCRMVDKEDRSFRSIGREFKRPAHIIARIYYSMRPGPRHPKLSEARRRIAQLKIGQNTKKRAGKRKLSLQIEKYRRQGHSLLEISRKLRVSRSRVLRQYHEDHPGQVVEYYRPRKNYAADPRGAEIDRLRHEEHLVFSAIGKILHMSQDDALKIYRARHPGPIPRLPRTKINYGHYRGIAAEAVAKARACGETYEAIARRFRVSRSTIQKIFDAARPNATKHRKSKSPAIKLTRPDIAVETVFDLLSSGWSVQQIADKFHVHHNVIRGVIKAGLAAGYRCRPRPPQSRKLLI